MHPLNYEIWKVPSDQIYSKSPFNEIDLIFHEAGVVLLAEGSIIPL
jgi:hypothetical protein